MDRWFSRFVRVTRTMAPALFALLALTMSGCSGCDPSGQTPIEYTEGITSADGTVYETTPIDGVLLHFPSGRVFDLVHGLQAAPYQVTSYLSFEPTLEEANLAESAGNQVVIEDWNERIIRVRNDTCEDDFYLRLVAVAAPEMSTAEEP